ARLAAAPAHYQPLCAQPAPPPTPLRAEQASAAIPTNPMAGGLLSGKHDPKAAAPEGSCFQLGTAGPRYRERYWHEPEFETVEALRKVAAEAGSSLATLAIRWALSNPAITAPIVGASRPDQLADSLAAAEQGALPKDLKARLDEITLRWRAVDAER